jgi:putative peptidoglycan lipid II flippase
MSVRASVKASVVVAAVTGVQGAATLLLDVVVASRFGSSEHVDGYQLAAVVPLLAINLLAGGTIHAVVIPHLTRVAHTEGRPAANLLLEHVRAAVTVLLVALAVALVVLFPLVLPRVASGFSPLALDQARTLSFFLIPCLVLGGLATVDSAALNSVGAFAAAAIVPATAPATAIVSVVLLSARLGIYALAAGILAGFTLQLVLARALSRREGFSCRPRFRIDRAALRPLAREYNSLLVSTCFLAGVTLTDLGLAARLAPGSVARFSYATRPVTLILAFATVVTANTAMAFFARFAARRDWVGLRRIFLAWVGLIVVTSVPVTILWWLGSESVVRHLFQRGRFGGEDVRMVAGAQRFYALQIPFYLLGVLGWRLHNVLGHNRRLTTIAAGCFTTNAIVGIWAYSHWGLPGIAGATSVAFCVWCVLIGISLRPVFMASPGEDERLRVQGEAAIR